MIELRDPTRAEPLLRRLHQLVEPLQRDITVMHVCGSHEQAIARYGLREALPRRLQVMMGPGCPVCVTDAPDVDAVVALARSGVPVLTWGDMLRVPGNDGSLDDARAEGAPVRVVTTAIEVVEIARRSDRPVLFFATGFETTAVATAAILLRDPPPQLRVWSAHKWVPAAMDVVAQTPGTAIEGYLAAGHAATVTGWGALEPFVAAHRRPVVVAGFEPLDILGGLVLLVEQIALGRAELVNAFPRCVTREGNQAALAALRQVFELGDGVWRGIAQVPGGELKLRPTFSAWDARVTWPAPPVPAPPVPAPISDPCLCGRIMTALARPTDCPQLGRSCRPETPRGACMVSAEGPCRIAHEAGL